MTTESWPITWWAYTGRYERVSENSSSPVMRNIATGEERIGRALPFGACFDASVDPRDPTKKTDHYDRGPDGCAIICICPTTSPAKEGDQGWWFIDGRASNCTMKNDNVHRCWVRHGTVGQPLHVDKEGNTCAAGAGSIQIAKWHGFLHQGVL